MIRAAFTDASAFFVHTVAQIPATQWDQPGVGVWTIRDLVGHTSRALATVEEYLARPASQRDLARPVDYYIRVRDGLADPASVAARGRASGAALGPDPASAVRDLAARVQTCLQRTADEALVHTPVGGMRLIDYLPSRIFELAVHTLDLAAALSLTVALPQTTASVALHLLADLALEPDKAATLLLATTGRQGWPSGFSLL